MHSVHTGRISSPVWTSLRSHLTLRDDQSGCQQKGSSGSNGQDKRRGTEGGGRRVRSDLRLRQGAHAVFCCLLGLTVVILEEVCLVAAEGAESLVRVGGIGM